MARSLKVEIVGDASSLQKALGHASQSTSKFGSSLRTLGKVAAVGVGAAFAGMAVVVKNGMDELSESQKVTAQTAAALKSTGGAAKVTAKEVEDLAGSLSRMSGTDDEVIQGAENLLLTFKNVRNEVGKGNDAFNRATAAALDLSQAGFGSIESAAKMMGKALNDPIKGLTALGRAGVTFSAEQKQTIKDLVATGHTLEAQKLILAEVESQVGGSAKAFGETLPGQLAKARNSFDEISAEVAVKFLPVLAGALTWVNANWSTISAVFRTVADGVTAAVQGIAYVVDWLVAQWDKHRQTINAIWTGILNAVQSFSTWFRGSFLPAVQSVIAIVSALWNQFGTHIVTVIQTAFGTIRTVVGAALANFASVINAFLAILRGDWGEAWDEISEIPGRTLRAALTVLKGMVTAFLTVAKALGGAVKDGVVAGIGAVAAWMGAKLAEIPAAIHAAAGAAGEAAVRIGQAIIAGVLNGLAGLWNAVKNKVEDTLRGVLGSLNPFSPVEHGGELHVGAPIVAGAVLGITKNTPNILAALNAAVKRITALAPAFHDAGKLLGDALATGLRDSAGGVVDAATELAAAIAKALGVAAEVGKAAAVTTSDRLTEVQRRAGGGPVRAGTPYIVGEQGPEIFWPGLSGQVIPNANTAAAGGLATGGITVNVYGSVTAERDLAETLRVELMRTGRYNAGGVLGGLA